MTVKKKTTSTRKLKSVKRKIKAYKKAKVKTYPQKPEVLIGGLSGLKGQFKAGLVPEIKVRYNKGKRFLGQIKCSDDVAKFIKRQYRRGTIETQEYFNILYLDRNNKILGYYQHAIGGISGVIADIRIIMATGLRCLACSMIISHNHPSGNLQPSSADIKLTQKVKKVAEFHDIPLLDHVIVTKESYYSFADENNL